MFCFSVLPDMVPRRVLSARLCARSHLVSLQPLGLLLLTGSVKLGLTRACSCQYAPCSHSQVQYPASLRTRSGLKIAR
ncbi:hypothetical protein BDV12DRAFT_164903 [Aspergillus spectabilis]